MAMDPAVTTRYTGDDLDWLRDELGMAHVELDPWGSLIVAPATDGHELAEAILGTQAVQQLRLPAGSVRTNNFAWIVPGGSGYLCVPDLTVLAPGWRRVDEWHLEPPPLLVAEIASPSTRTADRGRKLADYRLGGAGIYLLVDIPSRAGTSEVVFEAHDFGTGRTSISTGVVELMIDDQPLHFDLRSLALP